MLVHFAERGIDGTAEGIAALVASMGCVAAVIVSFLSARTLGITDNDVGKVRLAVWIGAFVLFWIAGVCIGG